MLRDGPDDRLADLDGELGELRLVEAAEVGGVLDGRQDRHGGEAPVDGRLGSPASVALTVRAVARVMIGSQQDGPGMGSARECKPVPRGSRVSRDRTDSRGEPLEKFVVDGLRASLEDRVITAADPGYDEARATFNATVARRPAVIVRARTVDDVVAAVVAAGDLGLPIAVRGGGHSVAGHAMADGALVVDLREMRAVTVDPTTRIVRVEGGALWDDVDAAAWKHHLAVVGGTFGDTGRRAG